MGLGPPPAHRDPAQGTGCHVEGLALQQEGTFQWAETPESEVRSVKPAPSSDSKAEDQGHLQCPRDSDRAEGAGLGSIPIPSSPSHCQGAALWSGHQAWCAPSPDCHWAREVEELQETRMLNYRAALETSNSSSTVARRGGSRAVNRNCGGSRGEQSEGSFCACCAACPSLPLGFCHLSRTPWPPA